MRRAVALTTVVFAALFAQAAASAGEVQTLRDKTPPTSGEDVATDHRTRPNLSRQPRTPVLEARAPHLALAVERERSWFSAGSLLGLLALLLLALASACAAGLVKRTRRRRLADHHADARSAEIEAELQEIIAEERARRRESLER